MDDETYNKIIEWIFDNHQHHWAEDEESCTDSKYPYVNSIKLEEFIKKLKHGKTRTVLQRN